MDHNGAGVIRLIYVQENEAGLLSCSFSFYQILLLFHPGYVPAGWIFMALVQSVKQIAVPLHTTSFLFQFQNKEGISRREKLYCCHSPLSPFLLLLPVCLSAST